MNQNIFKIEKKIGNFIKKILIVTDLEDFLTVEVSIKKKINDNLVDLKYLLNEAKDSCKNTIDERRIIHMIINSYCIDDIIYSSLPKDFKCKNFSIDVRFICLSNILAPIEYAIAPVRLELFSSCEEKPFTMFPNLFLSFKKYSKFKSFIFVGYKATQYIK